MKQEDSGTFDFKPQLVRVHVTWSGLKGFMVFEQVHRATEQAFEQLQFFPWYTISLRGLNASFHHAGEMNGCHSSTTLDVQAWFGQNMGVPFIEVFFWRHVLTGSQRKITYFVGSLKKGTPISSRVGSTIVPVRPCLPNKATSCCGFDSVGFMFKERDGRTLQSMVNFASGNEERTKLPTATRGLTRFSMGTDCILSVAQLPSTTTSTTERAIVLITTHVSHIHDQEILRGSTESVAQKCCSKALFVKTRISGHVQ